MAATKWAFWPGCVSKGAAPELYMATNRVAHLRVLLLKHAGARARRLIEFDEF